MVLLYVLFMLQFCINPFQIRQFNNFRNHLDVGLFRKPMEDMSFFPKDDEWKHVRNIISPTFSSGKLRTMTMQINRCCKVLVENLRAKSISKQAFDVKESTGAFTMDVIASTAFGLEVNSQKEPTNPLIVHAKKATDISSKNPVRLVLMLFQGLYPVVKWLGLSLIPKDSAVYFKGVVDRAMGERSERDKKTKTDFLQLLINAHQVDDDEDDDDDNDNDDDEKNLSCETIGYQGKGSNKKGLTSEQLIGQAFGFFFAGYGTVSDSLTYLFFLLALHPEIQDKVLDNIKTAMAGKEEPDYDTLKKMDYLDMVIQECLRLYPPVLRFDHVCNKATEVKGMLIPEGMIVTILIQALHMDPEAWPDPEKFDPERFTPECKAKRDLLYWQPFGVGPRQCIGIRLALMEIKMAVVHLLQNFNVKTCAKTSIPIKREALNGQIVDCFLTVEARV